MISFTGGKDVLFHYFIQFEFYKKLVGFQLVGDITAIKSYRTYLFYFYNNEDALNAKKELIGCKIRGDDEIYKIREHLIDLFLVSLNKPPFLSVIKFAKFNLPAFTHSPDYMIQVIQDVHANVVEQVKNLDPSDTTNPELYIDFEAAKGPTGTRYLHILIYSYFKKPHHLTIYLGKYLKRSKITLGKKIKPCSNFKLFKQGEKCLFVELRDEPGYEIIH